MCIAETRRIQLILIKIELNCQANAVFDGFIIFDMLHHHIMWQVEEYRYRSLLEIEEIMTESCEI
jgi:hypothetical protein